MSLHENSGQKDQGDFANKVLVEPIIKRLHNPISRLPRLEIPGWGDLSRETLVMEPFSGLVRDIKQMSDDEKRKLPAIYILKFNYEDIPYVTKYDWEYLSFPQSAITELAVNKISSPDAEELRVYALGKQVSRYDRWDDYAGVHEGYGSKSRDVKVALCLKKGIEGQYPKFYAEVIEDQEDKK